MFEDDKNTVWLLVISGIVILFSLALVSGNFTKDKNDNNLSNENKSLELAREFVERSQTYQFDGYDLKYNETLYPDLKGCENCYTFIFNFKSRHGGYGNRTGEMVTQVITPHEAHITIKNGEIIRATLDSRWDIIEQKIIRNE